MWIAASLKDEKEKVHIADGLSECPEGGREGGREGERKEKETKTKKDRACACVWYCNHSKTPNKLHIHVCAVLFKRCHNVIDTLFVCSGVPLLEYHITCIHGYQFTSHSSIKDSISFPKLSSMVWLEMEFQWLSYDFCLSCIYMCPQF